MIKYLIAGIFGFGVAKLLSKKPTTKSTKKYDKGGKVKAEDMLKDPLTIKRLNDLDDGDGWWFEYFHAKTKNYLPNTYYHVNTGGLNAGVGKGLYLGRDKDALISFYDQEEENKKVDAYIGNPNWFDLMRYEDYSRFIEEAIRKYGKNYVEKNSLADIDIKGEMLKKLAIEKGFDGIRYYDPQATGEEFVLFNTNKVKKLSNSIFNKGGSTNKGGDCYYKAGQLILNNEFLENKIDYIGTPYLVHAEVQGQGAISNLRYGHAWIEDDVFVYDYSNNRKIVLPKDFYYRIGDIKTNNPKKYRKYNFEQAKRKMLETKNYGCWDLEVEYKKGGRTISQTPAPKKDQIKGSDKNKEGSSKDTESAKQINFNEKTLNSIQNKVTEHNKQYPNKKITLASAKAVVRRGMGAYSNTYRPTISGGKPNSRVAWGLARLNAFTYKIINGKSKSGKYSQDDDLINELGYKVSKYEIGGVFHGSSYYFDKFSTNKIGSGIGQQQDGWGIYLTDDKENSKNYGNYIYETTLFKDKNLDEYTFLDLKKPVKKDLVSKIVEALYKNINKEFDINKFNLYYNYTKNKSLPKVDFNDYELIEFDYSGYLFYKTLSRILGGDKKASLFLLNNGIDGSISSFENSEGVIYRTDYVIFDENAITIENKEHLPNNYYADGGDIQAYEEAMGISEFNEGGEAKPKKVYVSITLNNEIQRNFPDYFWKYDEKTFEELKNGVLEGVTGVSSSKSNVAEWFSSKDCLIVIDYEKFIAINESETINYYDPYQLMKDNLYMFRRLYADITRYGEQQGSYVYKKTLIKILERIVPEIRLEINLAEGQKYKELYRIETFLNSYLTRAFPDWLEKNEIKIESPVDLTNAILEFNQLNEGASYLGYGFENPVLTFDELLPIVEKGIVNASRVFESEQEIILKNRKLVLPKESQLFFIRKDEIGRTRTSNQLELIKKYELKDLYKVYFVDRQDVEKYRIIWNKKDTEKKQIQYEKGRKELEYKKEQVLDDLLNHFLEKSTSYVKNELEKEYLEYSESLEFYDETNDEYIEQNLFSIPLVESIMNTYEYIIKNFWKSFIQKKQVKDLNIYAFDMFFFNVKQEIKSYFENKKDELEKLNNYRNTRGGFSLDPYRFQRLLLKTIDDYEKLPELIDYKKLAKMYLDKMGRELYFYYDKKDLPLISQYKYGGDVNEEIYYIPTDKSKEIIEKFTHYKSGENYYPKTLWAGWFLSQNRKNKEFIAEEINNNIVLKNALISNWYDDYVKSNNITFEDFLNKDIEVYRGQTSRDLKYGESYGFDSYTTYKSMAEHFAEDGNGLVIKKNIKPKLTYGLIESVGNEKEILIPTKFSNEFLEKKWYDLSNENMKVFDNLSDKDYNEFNELEKSKNYQGLIDKLNNILNIKSDVRYAKGGLIAPNGKKSNLTNSQYKLVRTKAFKEWFGDWENSPETASKVVDSNGEPLVVYHGTKENWWNDYFVFNPQYEGKSTNIKRRKFGSIYFTSKKKVAQTFGNILIPVFLNFENPIVIDADYHDIMWVDNELETTNYEDDIIIKNTYDYRASNVKLDADMSSDIFLVSQLFNKIKLADGTNTTFDSSNPDIRYAEGGKTEDNDNFKVVTKKEQIIDYLTRNSERWKERDKQYWTEFFETNQYIEQTDFIIKDLTEQYYNFYKKNPSFKKIPLIIYQNNISMGFGEGELFRYDFLHDLFISSNSKEYNILKNTKTVKINDVCNFTYEKYDNKVYGALMHEYGHYVNLGSAGYIDENWLIKNYEQIYKYISIYAGEKRIEFLAEVFALKNIPNYNELDKETKQFIISNYDNKIPVKNNFMQGGLIAPNGKPSNLTPEQYKLVRTPAFKQWFGDWQNDPANASKVVDENGEPLVVHRGNLVNQEELGYTFNLGNNFLYGKGANNFGFFFSNELDVAKKYMLVDHFDTIQGGSITSVFIQSNKILNLLDLDLKISQDDFVEILIKKGVYFDNEYNYLQKKILDFNPDNVKVWGYYIFDYFDFFPELRNLFIKNGFNCVLFYEISRRYSKYKVYVAFEPNQIKLADGTNTTFDSNNNDIRYAEGGEITLLKNKIKAPFLNKLYGQDVEPSGYYAIEKKTNMFDSDDNYETKKIKYKNPLYIDVDTDTLISWKYELSNKYKAKGKQLTEKLIKEGYDVIITKYPNGDKGEIIVLDTLKLNNNDIRYKTGGLIKRRSKK